MKSQWGYFRYLRDRTVALQLLVLALKLFGDGDLDDRIPGDPEPPCDGIQALQFRGVDAHGYVLRGIRLDLGRAFSLCWFHAGYNARLMEMAQGVYLTLRRMSDKQRMNRV